MSLTGASSSSSSATAAASDLRRVWSEWSRGVPAAGFEKTRRGRRLPGETGGRLAAATLILCAISGYSGGVGNLSDSIASGAVRRCNRAFRRLGPGHVVIRDRNVDCCEVRSECHDARHQSSRPGYIRPHDPNPPVTSTPTDTRWRSSFPVSGARHCMGRSKRSPRG